MYNASAYLSRAIASVDLQELLTEIILVDNNSTDDTFYRATEIVNQAPERIKLFRQPVQGAAAARNLGVEHARGKWIQFLDVDDELLPDKMARQVALGEQSGLNWVAGAYWQIEPGQKDRLYSGLAEDSWKGLVHNGGVGHTNSNLILREVYTKLDGQRVDLATGEDNDLYFRLLKNGYAPAFDPIPGSIYHRRDGSLSANYTDYSKATSIFLPLRVRDWLAERRPGYLAENRAFFNTAILNTIRVHLPDHPLAAKSCFKAAFPEGLGGVSINHEMLPGYSSLYNYFDFMMVENFRVFSKQTLSHAHSTLFTRMK